ncbi:1-aminocyclopropane-1-carboxylate synthase-like protein 1 [Diadema setosum]|uniref:1-aminocyclopropane-1-carboxylate synthase-like protein 1 n=1 Tax=Diadema setosum TaxID=31175 RepID=UPI003B3BD0DF
MLPYTPGRLGIPRLRSAISEFLTQQLATPEPLDPDKFCIASGVTSLICMMGYVLCNDGDTILTPSPLYGAIPRDFLFMPNVKTYPVSLDSKPGVSGTEPFELTVELLEDALKKARAEGHSVKALFLTNPYNPLGTVFPQEQVLMCLQFCKRHDLHCVVDEVYVCSIYDPDTPHSSLWGFHPDQLPDKSRTHVMWGLSKDFGMPGTPVGAVYSWNPTVISSLAYIVDFMQVPHFIQMAMAKLLEDRDWVQNVHLATNRRLLRESSETVMATLDEIGVTYVKPSAGLFIWANFNKYLQEDSLKGERALATSFLKNGIAIPSGAAFYYDNEYGWFRITFTVPRDQLVEAMKRLKQACTSQPGTKVE